jgi:uncharacterized protein with HEPN domain
MSKIDDPTRLTHMLEAATEALEFVSGRSRETLDRDRLLKLALSRELEIIGEAAAQISPECRARYPQMPWAKIIGMRNRLIHAYHDVDLDVLWDTVTLSLEPLIAELKVIVALETRS